MSGFVLSSTVAPGARASEARQARTSQIREAPVRPVQWLGWLAAMLRAIETRRHLAEMDARMLKDIGITRVDALEEAQRAPWDIGPRGV
jgi:uncharacterized protein YjiS (DUF1127 family)